MSDRPAQIAQARQELSAAVAAIDRGAPDAAWRLAWDATKLLNGSTLREMLRNTRASIGGQNDERPHDPARGRRCCE